MSHATRHFPGPCALRTALLLALCLLGAARPGTAFEARFAWTDGRPVVQVLVRPAAAAEMPAALPVSVRVFDAKDEPVWSGELQVAPGAAPAGAPEGTWAGSLPLEQPTEFRQVHRVEVALRQPALGLEAHETLYFTRPDSALWSYGLRRVGLYPAQRLFLTLALRPFRGDDAGADIPVHVSVVDAQENSVLDRPAAVPAAARAGWHALEITPPADGPFTGPFRADVSIEADAFGVFLNASLPFAAANALVPLCGFEDGDEAAWFAAAGEPPLPERSLSYYYSPQLSDLQKRTYPLIAHDPAEKRSGRQALRIEYRRDARAHVWARHYLPGKPTGLVLWVKGNGSGDQLWVTFEDFINYTVPAWQRNANFGNALVCTLDFTEWRRFRVPVLGDGLQATGLKGSSPAIDAPILLAAFSVHPVRPPRNAPADTPAPGPVWLDDLAAETQVATGERLLLELQADDADGELTAAGTLHVTVSSGLAADLGQGRLSLTARDAGGEAVFTVARDLAVPAGGASTAALPLRDLAALRPRGPVDLDVIFADAAVPAARVQRRLTLKSASQGGLCFDFETAEAYSTIGFRQDHPHHTPDLRIQPPRATLVAGGAEGSAQALHLPVDPADPGANGVLLHPALPGQLDRIEFWVKGDGSPVRLQVWFVDSGNTGVWQRPFNLFWPEPVLVDWSEWRKVTVKAPPVPPYYTEQTRWFFRRPLYPLNLGFWAESAADPAQAAALWLDRVRVRTHLPDSEEVGAAVAFPDDSRIHPPGAALELHVHNYAAAARELNLAWELRNYRGGEPLRGARAVTVAPGTQQRLPLLPRLEPGIYDLALTGVGSEPLATPLFVLEPGHALGPEPLSTLRDPVALRRLLGLLTEKAYLDWDNTEPVPNTFHFGWFNRELETRSAKGAFRMVPVLGFSADWAGLEAVEAIAKETYSRYIPNLYQVPARLIDWSQFVRECVREYRERFDEWVFWENPDIDGAPQFVPPELYPQMLGVLHQWVKQYNPAARVTAGGFNFNRVLDYLERIPEPHTLPFDDLAVQMNIGELSPETVDLEGFLDELDGLLQLRERGRRVQTAELDWGVGPFLSPLEQAAYHVRAALILHSRGALPHQFSLANGGFEFAGYGTFHRVPYGTTSGQQTLKPTYVPKPAFFAHLATQRFLKTARFAAALAPPDRSLDFNRAFLYDHDDGGRTLVLWRVAPGERPYRLPSAWTGATATDAFGFPASLDGTVPLRTLPLFLRFPATAGAADLAHALRHLEPLDGRFPVIADLHVTEPDAATRFRYQAGGSLRRGTRTGTIPGGGKVRQPLLEGIESETFTFTLAAPGHLLLRRRWFMDERGQALTVALNDGAPEAWDLTPGEGHLPGLRESTFVLRGARAGENRVEVRYAAPGNCALYRLEPVGEEFLELTRHGMLNARQTQGTVQLFRSAVGTPLRIGKELCEDGLGAHATSFIEYPLDGQFRAFEVTVGIDGHTEGRGSVLFRVFVDGKEKASSGTMSGFSTSKTLRVEDLAGARRLILSVTDAGDGNRNDLANWIDGRLFLK
jgi:hypothetical protein